MSENETPKQKYSWLLEYCPFCTGSMYHLAQHPTQNKRTLQQYIQTTSVCPHCDFWHTTDVPYAIARAVNPDMWLPTPEEAEKLEQGQKQVREPVLARAKRNA